MSVLQGGVEDEETDNRAGTYHAETDAVEKLRLHEEPGRSDREKGYADLGESGR